jgi:3-phosphoshikimate 1-carboxyvinyltransferase
MLSARGAAIRVIENSVTLAANLMAMAADTAVPATPSSAAFFAALAALADSGELRLSAFA